MSCNKPDETNVNYLTVLKRTQHALQNQLNQIDTVKINKEIISNKKFLIDFSLNYNDTLNKDEAKTVLELSRQNDILTNVKSNKIILVETNAKISSQLTKLETIVNENKEIDRVFQGLCHEYSALKQLSSEISKLNQTINNCKTNSLQYQQKILGFYKTNVK